MQSRFLLNVVVAQRATVFQLLARKNQPLLVGWDAFFVLNLGLHVLNRVRGIHVQRDGFAGERLDENLHFCRLLVGW